MRDGPTISCVAALIGDPARANILMALMDGRALTVTELSQAAGVTIQTASGHIAKLSEAALTLTEKQGRHRYIRLSGPDVAQVLEGLMGLAQRTGAVPVRAGPKDSALRTARVCYDHLAGERGVELFDLLTGHGLVQRSGGGDLGVTPTGRQFFSGLGIDMIRLEANRRPTCRACLDWSERRHHLGGALGAALLNTLVEHRWAIRRGGRVIEVVGGGLRKFAERLPG